MSIFLHSFKPQAILLEVGPVTIYWYGLILLTAIISAIFLSIHLGRYLNIKKDNILDLAFYLIIFGIIGARIYDIFLELPYYIDNPLKIFALREGGLAIHGGIIAGFITLYFFAKKHNYSLLKISALIAPGLALGQAIGRWGNWFNQELFGLPSNLPWSIPIDVTRRPLPYLESEFFHPTFLYESLACLFLFIILLSLFYRWRKNLNEKRLKIIIAVYLSSYAFIRFMLEFIKVDSTPIFLHLRWPQIASLAMLIIALIIIFPSQKNKN
jgi:phosphatidylglycerol---prolipoprotein diacylglyceryl transferase